MTQAYQNIRQASFQSSPQYSIKYARHANCCICFFEQISLHVTKFFV